MNTITVDKMSNTNFKTITEALNSVPLDEKVVILLKNGVYYEKLDIKNKYVTIIGEDKEKTIITYDDYALKKYDDGDEYGTFRTFTVNTSSDEIIFENLTIRNTAGDGDKVGQAVALSLCAKKSSVLNCNVEANQDTIFMSPFPEKPIIQNSFKGDFDKTPTLIHKNYFENCFIAGDIDFIFGGGIAFFNNCEIYSNDKGKEINGYVTAPSTYKGLEFGFVFNECKFTSDAKEKTVYLARPWRNYAKVAFIKCELGGHIKNEGYCNWNKIDSEETVYFAEYKCTGKGSEIKDRASFSKILTDSEVAKYTRENVLGY